MMTEKDFVKLNEEELKNVVGGAGLTAFEQLAFDELSTAEEASAYLIKCGVRPSQKEYHIYMDKWMKKNGN